MRDFPSVNLFFSNSKVAAFRMASAQYPACPPFHPGVAYPEYASKDIGQGENLVYEGVRRILHLLGLDAANYGTAAWNPFSSFIRPGDRVMIKPNLIGHRHEFFLRFADVPRGLAGIGAFKGFFGWNCRHFILGVFA